MLKQDQLQEVLARAVEIERGGLSRPTDEEIDALVDAAEETGISRQAVLQALRERIGYMAQAPIPGERVFAKSSDGNYYPAEVLSAESGYVRLRYLQGSEVAMHPADMKPGSLVPGDKVSVQWPGWGWWTCRVVSYDARSDTVKVTDGMSERLFPAAEVRLPKEKKPLSLRAEWLLWMAVSAASGGAIGSLLTWLLTR